jgi:hypothetical protein
MLDTVALAEAFADVQKAAIAAKRPTTPQEFCMALLGRLVLGHNLPRPRKTPPPDGASVVIPFPVGRVRK